MKSNDVWIDVTDVSDQPVPMHICATVHLPEAHEPAPSVLMFAFPGAGYSRGYFDLRIGDSDAYSQVSHHVGQGIIVVACDHLGVGDSTLESDAPFSLEFIASRNAAAVREIMRSLESGAIAADFPRLSGLKKIGAGQSMGGAILLLMQSHHQCFDAIVMLGSSMHNFAGTRRQLWDHIARWSRDLASS